MNIQTIIKHLETVGTWVNWNKTRDVVMCGQTDKEIDRMGVCWVATKQVLQAAKEKGIHFIISHENMMYENSTSPAKAIYQATQEKRAFCEAHDITVYRCHDVWDKLPVYGVADIWARDIGISCDPRITASYNQYATVSTTLRELAQKVADAVARYGQEGIQVVGDLDAPISRIAMGTGAATDIFSMLDEHPDVCIVSDDGISNWIGTQWAIDHGMALIVVNHAACEIGGIQQMVPYFQKQFPEIAVEYLPEGYYFHMMEGKRD